MVHGNGPEMGQYTPSFSVHIPVYFDVAINVIYCRKKLEKFELVGQGIGSRIDDFEPKLNR